MHIPYIDRKTGRPHTEKVYGHKFLLLFYGDGFFRELFSKIFLPVFSHVPFFSRLYGYLQKRPSSAKKVAPFIREFGVDESEFIETDFKSFNDFFIRKLKPETRPIDNDPKVICLPADGRYLVYPQLKDFIVKGQEFSLAAFLCNSALAARYKEGSMAIARLCPSDYHRFHFPCDGLASKATLVNGPLFSVNPMALKKRLAILAENKRMITEIETEEFGTMLYIEIGATNVGSIRQTYKADSQVKKGQEKGYFEFGGSCIVLLFERGRVIFDRDLVENTRKKIETRANFGEPLGRVGFL
jgi:phosphatidylserine decarboxylase